MVWKKFRIRWGDTIPENSQDFKSYLAAQAAAGTPVTIAYKLATPEPFQATGGQSLPALPGTNTIYTDADSVTVTGRADPQGPQGPQGRQGPTGPAGVTFSLSGTTLYITKS